MDVWLNPSPHSHDPFIYLLIYAATHPHLVWSKVSSGQPGAIESDGDKFIQLPGLTKGLRHTPVVSNIALVSAECTSFTLIESVELSRHILDLGQQYFDLHWKP